MKALAKTLGQILGQTLRRTHPVPGLPLRVLAAALFGTAVFGLTLGGCSEFAAYLEPEEELLVAIPNLPRWWRFVRREQRDRPSEEPIYLVTVGGEHGMRSERYIYQGELVGADVPRLRLRVEKESLVAVTVAYSPVPGLWLFAAGGVYPLHHNGEGRLELSYRNGFLAETLQELLAHNSEAVRNLNIARLEQELLERSHGNPRLLEREALLRSLSTGSMRADYIRLKPQEEVSLQLPFGRWISRDPLVEPLMSSAHSDGFTVTLQTGVPQLWYQPGLQLHLSVVLNETGVVEHLLYQPP